MAYNNFNVDANNFSALPPVQESIRSFQVPSSSQQQQVPFHHQPFHFCLPPVGPPMQPAIAEKISRAGVQISPPSEVDISDEQLKRLVSKYRTAERPKSSKPNVSSIKMLLSEYNHLIISSQRILKYLEVTKKTLSQSDWLAKRDELERKKDLLLDLQKNLNDPDFVRQVNLTVKRLKSKRKQRQRKKMEWKEKKKEMRDIRDVKHKKIDLWLEKMKNEVERAHREEMVKKEADMVLSEVTSKKTEAKRILGLLNSLAKLRNAKLLQLKSSGKHVSEEETKSFTLVIDKLKGMWAKQLKEYNLEEQGLKVMLDEAEVERVNTEERLWRKNLHLWTETIFGERNLSDPLQAQPADFDEFLSVRRDWDQFIASEDSLMSSCIPYGWVVPSKPSNSDWANYILP